MTPAPTSRPFQSNGRDRASVCLFVTAFILSSRVSLGRWCGVFGGRETCLVTKRVYTRCCSRRAAER